MTSCDEIAYQKWLNETVESIGEWWTGSTGANYIF